MRTRPWKCWFSILPLLLLTSGCVPNRPYQVGKALPVLPSIPENEGLRVATIEFDGMGELWDRCDLDGDVPKTCELRDTLKYVRDQRVAAHAEGARVIVITYVHGWHHNANPNDKDLAAFSRILKTLQSGADAKSAPCMGATGTGCGQQKVRFVGVYLAWRGEVIHTVLSYATAFDREKAGQRTALVSMSEVLVRLRNAAKQTNADNPAMPKEQARFLLFGHSYGGMIVERNMAQMLTAALLPEHRVGAGTCDDGKGQEPFADLVFLINPAGDAIETEQLIDLMKRSKTRVCSQPTKMAVAPPLIVSIHARNDFWTGKGFAIGHGLESTDKVFRKKEPCTYCDSGAGESPGQGYTYRHTGGAVAYFTNFCYIDGKPTGDPICDRMGLKVEEAKKRAGLMGTEKKSSLAAVQGSQAAQHAFAEQVREIAAFPKASLETTRPSLIWNLYKRRDPDAPPSKRGVWNTTPYWIFTVPKQIVDKHGGFWTADFTDLITNIIDVTTPPPGKGTRVE